MLWFEFILANVIIPCQVLATGVAIMVVDRLGRRILLILSAGENKS